MENMIATNMILRNAGRSDDGMNIVGKVQMMPTQAAIIVGGII